MNHKRLLLTLALAAALLLSGCASEQARSAAPANVAPAGQTAVEAQPAPSADVAPARPAQAGPSPALPEPCDLLTKADLATVLVEPFSEGESGELPSTEGAAFELRNCAFHSGDKQVVLTLFPARSPYQEQKELAAFGAPPQAVGGLGDEAFWASDSHELWVASGQITMVLGFDFMDASPDVATPLVQQALRRLK